MDSKPTGIADGFAATKGCGRIHYREAGSGAVLLLLHSNGGSAYQFDAVAAALASGMRVVSWTMPGHGDSDPLTRHYSIDDYADAVIELMDALRIDRAHIAGSSVGGSIAAAIGARYPARTLSAIVVEAPCRTYAEWGARWGHTEGNFSMPLQNEQTIKERVANASAATMSRWNIDRNKAGARVMVDVMWAIREFDVRAALSQIVGPGAIVYGRKGPNLNDQDRLKSAAPRLPVIVLDESGHFPMLDAPEAFAAVLQKIVVSAHAA